MSEPDRPDIDAGQVPDSAGHPPRQALTLAQAAAMLGVSTRTVRRRLQSGDLEGEKIGGAWVVYLRTLPGIGSDSAPDSAGQVPVTNAGELAALRRYVDRLERELDQRNAELGALHVQIDRLTRALPAPEDDTRSADPGPWWSRILNR